MNAKVRVLVVDDSAFLRNAITSILSKAPDIDVVGQACNGNEAIQKVKELSPDVMTLDIEMPGMNGLDVLATVMKKFPLPVIMISSLTHESAKETMKALELGAVDFISKQLNGAILDLSKFEKILLSKVRVAGSARSKIAAWISGKRSSGVGPLISGELTVALKKTNVRSQKTHAVVDCLVVIGSSTGGPKVVQQLFEEFPSTLSCAMIVIQHMPKFFTKSFAERLDQSSPLSVREAEDEDVLQAGSVLVAPGGRHLRLEQRGVGLAAVRISDEPANLPYRPSVDIAMESGAKIFGSSLVGVVLTGMGNDGERGMQAVKAAGGITIVQDESTSLIYGMPKAVAESGCADVITPISEMSHVILHHVEKVKRRKTGQFVGV